LESAATFIFLAIVVVSATLAVTLTARLLQRGGGAVRAVPIAAHLPSDILHSYRFREGYLLSDIGPHDAFLDSDTDRVTALRELVNALSPLSSEIGDRMKALLNRGDAFLLEARIGSDPVSVCGRMEEDELVLSIGPSAVEAGRQVIEAATLENLRGELADLRAILDTQTALIWREDERHRVVWGNAAYVALAEEMRNGDTLGWPLPHLFEAQLEPAPSDGTLRRCQLELPDQEEPTWFEVGRELLPGQAALFTAQRIDRLVAAENSLRAFLQTSTKTFAALPIGLAVFDRRRQLVTFNPALLNLMNLSFNMLSDRPSLSAFLDGLRERQRIPEPRDYKAWRNEMSRLEEGAESGTFHELWELPDGKTFRVLGRPHPDGAIAFMFEDISSEVSLTRKFRSDLDMYQAVLDTLPVGLGVFDGEGVMQGWNEGYTRLWGHDPSTSEQAPKLADVLALWSGCCEPSGVWGDIRQFVANEVERGSWVEEVCTRDGLRLAVRMEPGRGRTTVVQFLPLDDSMTDPLSDLVSHHPDTPLLDALREAASPGTEDLEKTIKTG